MKLAEALITRADLQRRLEQLRVRITQNARHQEGDDPAEDASALIEEAIETVENIERLVVAINLTNASTRLPNGETLTAALGRRDALRATHAVLTSAAEAAQQPASFSRQMRSELREIIAIPVQETRRRADDIARRLRELEIDVQRANWEVDLIEQ